MSGTGEIIEENANDIIIEENEFAHLPVRRRNQKGRSAQNSQGEEDFARGYAANRGPKLLTELRAS